MPTGITRHGDSAASPPGISPAAPQSSTRGMRNGSTVPSGDSAAAPPARMPTPTAWPKSPLPPPPPLPPLPPQPLPLPPLPPPPPLPRLPCALASARRAMRQSSSPAWAPSRKGATPSAANGSPPSCPTDPIRTAPADTPSSTAPLATARRTALSNPQEHIACQPRRTSLPARTISAASSSSRAMSSATAGALTRKCRTSSGGSFLHAASNI
mmetsp:Transcript_24960/g.74150  ORF Transcript_24960/g.74150 Transcript_24960/m.74150 type:complete len:212 (+) Transcript_24960:126-761(+)